MISTHRAFPSIIAPIISFLSVAMAGCTTATNAHLPSGSLNSPQCSQDAELTLRVFGVESPLSDATVFLLRPTGELDFRGFTDSYGDFTFRKRELCESVGIVVCKEWYYCGILFVLKDNILAFDFYKFRLAQITT